MINPFDEITSRLEEISNRLERIEQASPAKQAAEPLTAPITTKELCTFLNVTEPTIIRWKQKGKIPFYNIGSAVRFDLKKVLAALEN